MKSTRFALPALLHGSLGIWLGIQALHAFMAMVTWNVAEDAAASQMGLVAFGVWAVGLLAWPVARFLGGRRPAWRFGLLVAALSFARQLLPGELLSPLFSFAAVVAWLWWLPAYLQEASRRAEQRLVAPAVLLGLAAQSALQAALHGLDLPMLRSLPALVMAGLLAVGFAWALWQSAPPDDQPGAPKPGLGWGAVALFLFLFLQLTLLTNLGRVIMLSGWSTTWSAVLIQVALLAALLALGWAPRRWLRLVLGVVAVALVVPAFLGLPWAVWALVPLQALLGLLLAACLTPGGRTYGGFVAGALLFLVILFLYYSTYGWTDLWLVGTGLLAVLALRSGQAEAELPILRSAGILVAVALVGLGVGLIPASTERPSDRPAPGEFAFLNYNIHQGFDVWSVPSMQALADQIAAADADVVALQEVNRGWNLSGGVDMVSYLQWRFPQYHMVYGPMNGELWGNVIMSRYPVKEWGTHTYPLGKSDFPRGLVWARLAAEGGDLTVMSTHFSAYEGFDEDRIAQSQDLLGFWKSQPRTIIAGDFNARQDDVAVQTVLQGGLTEVTREPGLWDVLTHTAATPYERLDYIFMSPDLTAVSAEVPAVTASDHRPVLGRLRMP